MGVTDPGEGGTQNITIISLIFIGIVIIFLLLYIIRAFTKYKLDMKNVIDKEKKPNDIENTVQSTISYREAYANAKREFELQGNTLRSLELVKK
tara:strand:- start:188 stop:469 length:282 start_codon:yes stop_codon:yes gene_type:complete